MTLLGRRRSAASPFDNMEPGGKIVLHVGCGPSNAPESAQVPDPFRGPGWRELRLDIDPDVKPDIIGSIVNMKTVPSESVEAVWSCHNLEHVYAHEVPVALREFHRVLRAGGMLALLVPDLQSAASVIAEGKLERPLYRAGDKAISALDVVFGHGFAIARGNTFMAHHTGFTAETLAGKLRDTGFGNVHVRRREVALLAARAQKAG